jgi:hypothetical protein
MRVFKPVLRWLSAGILVLIILLLVSASVAADTGTYKINNYGVTLEPQSDGRVKITYEQDWQVTGGDIPWVTVGLPNSNFTVQSYGGNAAAVYAYNAGEFQGVRADLDKDYKPGQTFKVTFTVLQSNLLEKLTNESKWRINFTPGWYDNATIDRLQIALVSPVAYDAYSSVTPSPTAINNNVISWERTNLSPGSRFSVKVESPDGSFLSASVPVAKSGGISLTTLIIIIAIIVIGGALIFWAIKRNREARDAELKERVVTIEAEMAEDKAKKEQIEEGFEKYVEKEKIQPDAEGRYYDAGYGNYITPAIWAAVILPQMSEQHRATGGGGGHCACVSCACACACACAGGGAAGCSRKTLHECRKSKEASVNAGNILLHIRPDK